MSVIKQCIHGILVAHNKKQVCSHCDTPRYTASTKTGLRSTDPLSSYDRTESEMQDCWIICFLLAFVQFHL